MCNFGTRLELAIFSALERPAVACRVTNCNVTDLRDHRATHLAVSASPIVAYAAGHRSSRRNFTCRSAAQKKQNSPASRRPRTGTHLAQRQRMEFFEHKHFEHKHFEHKHFERKHFGRKHFVHKRTAGRAQYFFSALVTAACLVFSGCYQDPGFEDENAKADLPDRRPEDLGLDLLTYGTFTSRSRVRVYRIEVEDKATLRARAVRDSRNLVPSITLFDADERRISASDRSRDENVYYANFEVPAAGEYYIVLKARRRTAGKFYFRVGADYSPTGGCDKAEMLHDCASRPWNYRADDDSLFMDDIVDACLDFISRRGSPACVELADLIVEKSICRPIEDIDGCLADPESYIDEDLSGDALKEACLEFGNEAVSACGVECYLSHEELDDARLIDADDGYYGWLYTGSDNECAVYVNNL